MTTHFLWGNLRLIQTPECKQAQGLSLLTNSIFMMRNMRPVRNNSTQPDDQVMVFLTFFATQRQHKLTSGYSAFNLTLTVNIYFRINL